MDASINAIYTDWTTQQYFSDLLGFDITQIAGGGRFETALIYLLQRPQLDYNAPISESTIIQAIQIALASDPIPVYVQPATPTIDPSTSGDPGAFDTFLAQLNEPPIITPSPSIPQTPGTALVPVTTPAVNTATPSSSTPAPLVELSNIGLTLPPTLFGVPSPFVLLGGAAAIALLVWATG